MTCPVCRRTLNPLAVGDVTVEICSGGCAGIWFERGKLDRFADPADPAGEALAAMSVNPQMRVDVTQRRQCPKCSESVLMRHFFSAKRAVTVDECPTCAGVWLDAGELSQIRSEYASNDERRQAARASFEEALVDDRMALLDTQIREQVPLETSRSRLIASLLVVAYVVVALGTAGVGAAVRVLWFCVVPWVCVSFPESLATVVSPMMGTTRASPRRFVWFFGWLTFILPVIQIAIILIGMAGR